MLAGAGFEPATSSGIPRVDLPATIIGTRLHDT